MAMLGVAFGGLGSLLSGASLLKMGFMAASALGMYLLNGKKEKGEVGRLQDLKVSSSTYGRGIPIVYGTMRVTGNMFWATDFVEVLKYMSPKPKGKKGSKKGTPYYEYYANFAMALCEGPVEELLRVWADSNLIYDKHNPDNKDLVGPGFSREDGQGGGKSGFGMGKKKGNDGGDSGRFTFRYYAGTEDQMPDPFMLSKQGADLVPAHRGLCYLFFEHFALMDFGNRIPTITAEVAVRKKQVVSHAVLTNMEGGEDWRGYNDDSGPLIDPERYRLYNMEIHDPSGERGIRVYDLSTETEIRRITFAEINTVNEDTPDWHPDGIHAIIGLAGTGDLVARLNGGGPNNRPIAFLDPNTFIAKKVFGNVSLTPIGGLSNGPNKIVFATKAVPTFYLKLVIKLSGEVEVVPVRCTIVQSMFGHYYIFGDEHEPITYFEAPGGEITPVTPEDFFMGIFYITRNSNGFSSAIYEVKWHARTAIVNGQYTIDFSEATQSNIRTIRELDEGRFCFIYHTQIVAGAEKVCWFEAIDDNIINGGGYWIVAADPMTGQITWRERINDDWGTGTIGFDNKFRPMQANTSNEIKWFRNGKEVWTVNIRTQQISYVTLAGEAQRLTMEGNNQLYWPARGAIVRRVRDPYDNEWKWAMTFLDRNDQVPADIDFIIRDLARRVNIPASRVDTTELNDQEIKGYLIENPTSARRVVEELASVFMFDVAEIDYKLKVVSRGKEPVITVPQKDLAVVDDDTQDYFVEVISQEIDLPQTVVVSYINAGKDYTTNTQHYRRPRSPMATMQSRDKLEINLAMALDNDFAKQMAHKVCKAIWTERVNYEFMLPWTYLLYDPTDVMFFQMDSGLALTARMMKMDLGANLSIEATGVSQTPAAYTSDITAGEDGGVIPGPKNWPPQTEPVVTNVPYLRDEDDSGNGGFTFYYGAGALGPGLKGAAVEYNLPGQPEWELVGMVPQEVVWGHIQGVVPPPPHGPYATDDETVITLLPSHPYENEAGLLYEWQPIPESQWPSTQNCIIIGEEVIYFRDVEVMPSGAVRISHLIRGARGTEEAAYHHGPVERFVIATDSLLERTMNFEHIRKVFSFRTFSTYSLFPPYRRDVRLDGASHMPWGPNYFKRAGDTNITISWERRTRLGGELKNGTGTIPLNEESELYDLFLLEQPYDPDFFDPDNPATYKRAYLDRTSRSVTYSTAEQLADGFTSDMPLHVVCFQKSANVGRGFPGYATLYKSILI